MPLLLWLALSTAPTLAADAAPAPPDLEPAPASPGRTATLGVNLAGTTLIGVGATSLVVGTGCSSTECSQLFVGGGIGLFSAGSIAVGSMTLARGIGLRKAGSDRSVLVGAIGAGLVIAGPAFIATSLIGVDTALEGLAVPGLVMTAVGLPLVVVQGVRNGQMRRSLQGDRVGLRVSVSAGRERAHVTLRGRF